MSAFKIRKTKLGFMQGRLVKPYFNFIQYFPDMNWEKELKYAKKIGLKKLSGQLI